MIGEFKTKGSNETDQWSPSTCTSENGPTDAYGEIKFIGFGESTSKVRYKARPFCEIFLFICFTDCFKYIRVHFQTPIDKIIRLMYQCWNLKEPKLLISVTGGAQRFSLKPRLKDVFRKGLVKAAVSTGPSSVFSKSHFRNLSLNISQLFVV